MSETDEFYEEQVRMVTLLEDDVIRATELLRQDITDQYHRRNYVRAVFAYIEGTIYAIKQGILDEQKKTVPPIFSEAEIALMSDFTHEIDSRGNVVSVTARITLEKNLRFAFKSFARSSEIDYELDFAGTGWQAMRAAVAIRNRLMHPKSQGQLIVTNDEIRAVYAAHDWFRISLNGAYYKKTEELKRQTEHFKAQREEFIKLKKIQNAILEYQAVNSLSNDQMVKLLADIGLGQAEHLLNREELDKLLRDLGVAPEQIAEPSC